MRRWLIGAVLVVCAVAALAYVFRVPLTLRLVERVIAANLSTDLLLELPDGLHVALCGAGSPFPDPTRSGPCAAVIAGDRVLIVDVGSGSSRVLCRMRLTQAAVEAILLTHFHSDHIDGLGELLMQRWVTGTHTKPTPVYGPEGVTQVVAGFGMAYARDNEYRVAHHGVRAVPPSGGGGVPHPFRMPAEGDGQVVLDDDGLVVTAFRVSHDPIEPAVGYRFDYHGRSVVFSGDTTKSATVQRFAEGVDLLVHEALSPTLVGVITRGTETAGRANLTKITTDILDYHTSPVEAAEIARDAGVAHLLLNHIVPALLLRPMEAVFMDGVDEVYDGPVTLGRDGTLLRLDTGTDTVEVVDLL